MEKKSKRELIALITEQEDRVIRYESRFTDVVKAYKSLAKEKDALEATIKALTTKSPARGDKGSSSAAGKAPAPADPLGASSPDTPESNRSSSHDDGTCNNQEVQDDDQLALDQKIETLSQALATVTEEKSKMEAAYQADKKKTLQRHGTDIDEYCQEIDSLKATAETLEAKLSQSRNKVCQQQGEREKEQEDHAIMLKEFQALVAKERTERESAEEALRQERQAKNGMISDKDGKVDELTVELELLNEKVKQLEDDKKQPDGNALKVMEDLYRERQQHEVELTAERKRAIEAEEGLRLLSLNSEKRSTEMEIQISEMASLIGKYEHTHVEDQKKINKLKEQLSLIGDDNRLLANQVANVHEVDTKEAETAQRQQQEIFKLKGLLRVVMSKGEPTGESDGDLPSTSLEIDELLQNNDTTHQACLAAYRQLKEENETLKNKMASSKAENTTNAPKEIVSLRQRSDTLQQELTAVRDYYDNKEHELSIIVSKLQCDITRSEEQHKTELECIEERCNDKIRLLNDELKKQRLRTEDLLAEKELELERLTANCNSPTRKVTSRSNIFETSNHVDMNTKSNKDATVDSDGNSISSLLSSKPSNGSNGLVHYSQQLDRMGNDLTSMRFENEDIKLVLRDAELREEKVLQQMGFLKEEIRKLERDRSRETANLEYLKNVVLQYLLTDTLSVRQQMTNAMSTILQFSPSEMKQVTKKSNSWWPVT